MNKKTKICLNSMVGNESKTITRMLNSVAPYIDYYVIQCNGNQDNTREIIDTFFNQKGIKGFTYYIDWNFPGWNRDHTLKECLKSEHSCDWILRMDADEMLYVDENFDWSILDNTSIDSFNITADAGDSKYLRTWLWNANRNWFFQHDKRHETIHLPEIGENFQRVNMPFEFRHIVFQDGETWYVPRKFLKDALELEIDKVVGNTILHDPYHLWYLAKSYADSYINFGELPFGKIHAEEYARRSNWYFERFLETVFSWNTEQRVIRNDEMGYLAFVSMAINHSFLNSEPNKIFELFEYAEKFCGERNEGRLYKSIYMESIGMYNQSLKEINEMISPQRLNPFPKYCFLIENRAYIDTGNFLFEMKKRLEETIKNLNH